MSRFRTGKSKKYAKGQSIIEVMVGGFILIPLLLAIIDVSVVAIGGELVNRLSKEAARAAANCSNKTLADAAVVDIKNTFQPSSTFKNLNIAITDYVGTADGQLTAIRRRLSSNWKRPFSIKISRNGWSLMRDGCTPYYRNFQITRNWINFYTINNCIQ